MNYKLNKKQKATILIGLLRKVEENNNSRLEVEVDKGQEFHTFKIKLILRRTNVNASQDSQADGFK